MGVLQYITVYENIRERYVYSELRNNQISNIIGDYIKYIEDYLEIPISLISVGQDKKQSIIKDKKALSF